MNVMDAGDVRRGSTLTVHGTHLGMHVDDDHGHGGFCDLKAEGWSTALCECMSPDATSIFDWGYVCTSCACPCLQFYFNWLSILKGAPVCGLHLKTCRCLLLGPATHTCFMACTMLACLRCQCQDLYSRPAPCVPPLRACLQMLLHWHFVSTGREILLHGRPLLQVRGPSACCQYDVVLHCRLSIYLLQSSRGKFGMPLSTRFRVPWLTLQHAWSCGCGCS